MYEARKDNNEVILQRHLSSIIYGFEYRFLILRWIRAVIFHSRRLVTKNMFS